MKLVPMSGADDRAQAHTPSAEEIERGLTEFGRGLLADSYRGFVCADRGNGHAVNALRRRLLVEPQFDEKGHHNITWGEWMYGGPCWRAPLTPLGVDVAALVLVSERPGGGP